MQTFRRIEIDHCVLTSFFEFENQTNFRKQQIQKNWDPTMVWNNIIFYLFSIPFSEIFLVVVFVRIWIRIWIRVIGTRTRRWTGFLISWTLFLFLSFLTITKKNQKISLNGWILELHIVISQKIWDNFLSVFFCYNRK